MKLRREYSKKTDVRAFHDSIGIRTRQCVGQQVRRATNDHSCFSHWTNSRFGARFQRDRGNWGRCARDGKRIARNSNPRPGPALRYAGQCKKRCKTFKSGRFCMGPSLRTSVLQNDPDARYGRARTTTELAYRFWIISKQTITRLVPTAPGRPINGLRSECGQASYY